MSHGAKWIAGGGLASLAAATVIGGLCCFGGGQADDGAGAPAGPAPTERTETPEQVAAYLASEAFASRPLDDRLAYLTALQEDDPNLVRTLVESETIPAERRQQVRKNVGEAIRERTAEHVREYIELPTDERPAYLDKIIDDMEARHLVTRQSADGSRGPGQRPVNAVEMLQRIRSRLEGTDPADRAKHIQFLKGMRARMAKRGLRPNLGGPGGMPLR